MNLLDGQLVGKLTKVPPPLNSISGYPPSRQSASEFPPFPLFNTPMLSLPSPFSAPATLPLFRPQPFNLDSRSEKEGQQRERTACAWLSELVLKCMCVCYAGDRALSAAFGQWTKRPGHHEDGPVPVRRGRRLGSAGAAAGTAPRSMGRAVYKGENWFFFF